MEELLIGIDLGGTFIKGGLVDRQGSIIAKEKLPTRVTEGPEAVAQDIVRLVKELGIKSEYNRVVGIGIGIPGQIKTNGVVIYAPNLGWTNVPLGQMINEIKLPIGWGNDANLAALGEKWLGAGQGAQNMVMVTVGTGIGTGLLINGQIYIGANGNAGELGHTIIDPNGPQCSCGQRGCLETFCSAKAMVKKIQQRITEGASSILTTKPMIDARDIVDAARGGDALALDIFQEAVRYLGIGLGNIVNILNPDRIVVGGGIAEAGAIFFEPLKRSILEHSLKSSGQVASVVPAELGNDAGLIGAAKLVIDMGG